MGSIWLFRFVLCCVYGGFLSILWQANLFGPALIAVGIFMLIKGRITDHVMEQVNKGR
jgi:uncharacterized membrane protein